MSSAFSRARKRNASWTGCKLWWKVKPHGKKRRAGRKGGGRRGTPEKYRKDRWKETRRKKENNQGELDITRSKISFGREGRINDWVIFVPTREITFFIRIPNGNLFYVTRGDFFHLLIRRWNVLFIIEENFLIHLFISFTYIYRRINYSSNNSQTNNESNRLKVIVKLSKSLTQPFFSEKGEESLWILLY